jgi:putative membrane protein
MNRHGFKLTGTRTDRARRLLLALPLVFATCQRSGDPRQDVADNNFAGQVASASASMVALGQMAARRSANPAVRQFAQRVVVERTMINRELIAVARRKGVQPPTAPGPEDTEAVRELLPYAEAAFDQQYLAQQVRAHDLQRTLFRNQAQEGTDAELRAFAERYLPVVEAHAWTARAVFDSVADPMQ